MVINFMVTEFLLVTQWIFLQGGELFEGHGSSRCTDLSSFSMDLFGAFLTPSSWQKSFSQFVVIVIIVIPKLLQVYSCAKCHSYWVLVWCKDVWVMQHCSELQTLRGRSLRKCQRVLQLMFPSCSEFSQGFGCQCQPKTLRYFKQYGAEASGSLIHPHMQNLGRDSDYNGELRFEGPWVDSKNSMIKNKKPTKSLSEANFTFLLWSTFIHILQPWVSALWGSAPCRL